MAIQGAFSHGFSRAHRVIPSARGNLDDARANLAGDDGTGQNRAPVVEDTDDVAIRDAPPGGVFGVKAHGLSPPNLAIAANSGRVHLAVEPGDGLIRNHVERMARALLASKPFGRL